MKKCSVVIITYNEEKNIEKCLQSVERFADEIVVVDSYSTDNTKKICIAHNVRFIEHAFEGYIEQKNFALAQAANDYVLSLDADEAVDSVLLQNIMAEKQKGFAFDGYEMNRSNFFCGRWIRHGTWYPDRKLRLINRQKAQWGGINPHDKIIMQPKSSLCRLKGDILHYTYYTIEELVAQTNRFTTIQAEAMFAANKKPGYVKLYLSSLSAFVVGYFIKLGFLDGYDGFIIARSVAYGSMLKYAKLRRLWRNSANK
ncbi:MAG TPA: glycosyltransferase family 2 protein [Chitinophagaceae bacterium]|nr:glycosyltransferase family 2 protein [Chitinophagaceae bacterium]